jgi:hypothetical protein
MAGFRRARGLFSTGLLVACALVALTPSAQAIILHSSTHKYAGVAGTGGVSGIDGYIRKSTTIMADTTQFHAAFVNLCKEFSPCGTWIQTGPYQGSIGGMRPTPTVSTYGENNSRCGYKILNYGPPPAPNSAYYISYVDSYNSSYLNCGFQVFYRMAIHIGSLNSPPVGYFLFTDSGTGKPVAEEEVYFPHVDDDLGNDYFGVDNSFQASPAHGLHVWTSGSWLTWTTTTQPYTTGISNNPPFYHTLATYYSFKASD